MCGLVGLWSGTETPLGDLQEIVGLMSRSLAHRGPDDDGVWCDPKIGLAMGFRRLAILDLSAAGHQPMLSQGCRYMITFNGEIYNAPALRSELLAKGHSFRGHSDTEVMLAAFEEWGVEDAVQHFIGMFAFALWDLQLQVLWLVRDRLGIKPLYYGWQGTRLFWASELKALRAIPNFQAEIDMQALTRYLQLGYVPSPDSIYRNVYKLPQGSILRLDSPVSQATPVVYWSVHEAAIRGLQNPFQGTDSEAIEELENLLKEAVHLRMLSDVPLGAFLSGGIDSSTVVALMQAQSGQPVKTFTIGFAEATYDEATQARQVARHLGTDHTEIRLSPRDAQEVIPVLPEMFDEPFADSSQIPTYLVSRLTRNKVTVSLSGDGGDELFAGYVRYLFCARLWSRMRLIPLPLRARISSWLLGSDIPKLDTRFKVLRKYGKFSGRIGPIGHKLAKLGRLLSARTAPELVDALGLVQNAADLLAPPHQAMRERIHPTLPPEATLIQHMQYEDTVGYLADDILTKVDRASMAISLEARVPMLDHRLVEFAWRLPMQMKLRHGQGKWLLRQVLYRHVPRELVERPKSGFAMPVEEWLRGDLRDWAESLLSEARLRQQGFFDPAGVRERWRQHLTGLYNWDASLWKVLMFQAWHDRWGH